MIRVEQPAWDTMVSHAEKTFPKECCGVMLGSDGVVREAVPLPNVYTGPQEDFFVMDPLDLHRVDVEGAEKGPGCVGSLSLASRLRRVFLETGPGEFLLLVLIRRTIDKERALRSRQ